jgi:hypothetical protein
MGSSRNESMFPIALMALLFAGAKKVDPRDKYTTQLTRIYHNPAFGMDNCLFTDVEPDPMNSWVSAAGYLYYEIDKDTKFYGWDGWRTIYQLRVKKILREDATMTLRSYENRYKGVLKDPQAEVRELKAGDAVWLAKADDEWMPIENKCPREYEGYESRRNLEMAFGRLWTGISRTTAYLMRDLVAQTTCFENKVVEIYQDGYLDLYQPMCTPAYKVDGYPAYPYIGHASVALDMYTDVDPVHSIYKASSWDDFEGLKYILEDIAIDIGCKWIQLKTGIPKSICVAAIKGDSMNFDTAVAACKDDPKKCYDFLDSLI